jgi:hypothetical protein
MVRRVAFLRTFGLRPNFNIARLNRPAALIAEEIRQLEAPAAVGCSAGSAALLRSELWPRIGFQESTR